MLDKIRNMLGRGTGRTDAPEQDTGQTEHQSFELDAASQLTPMDPDRGEDLEQWARKAGRNFTLKTDGTGFALEGEVDGHEWRMERGAPSRDYINHTELRARIDLDLNPDAQLMVMSRSLKRALDNNVYSQFTNTLQTIAHSRMPEEMLWLTMYPEVGWKSLGEVFVEFFSILAESEQHARAWIDDGFIRKMTKRKNLNQHQPFVMMIMRGKLYMRCEFDDNPDTLEGLVELFECAAHSAHRNRDVFSNLA